MFRIFFIVENKYVIKEPNDVLHLHNNVLYYPKFYFDLEHLVITYPIYYSIGKTNYDLCVSVCVCVFSTLRNMHH